MSAKKLGFRCIVGVVTVGCGCSGGSTDQLDTSQDLKYVRLDDLNDLYPVIREQIDRIENAAHRLADPDWHHVDWHERWHPPSSSSRRIARTDYRALWCARSSDPIHFCSRSTEPPYHCITLRLSPHQKDPKRLRHFYLSSRWQARDDGFSVGLRYHVDQSYSDEAVVTDRFSVVFSREEQESPGTYTGLRLPDGGLSFSKQYGDYEYKIWARTNWHPRDQDARKLLASAETLRDDGLARFDELERWTEEQLETGELVRWVVDHGKTEEVADGDTGLEIPQDLTLHPPFPHEYQLSNQQKQDILSDARAELDRRRNLLRENYRELYSAAHAAFPLHESLTEP